MNICFISSEAIPYVKTGGLADVVGSLPVYLAKRGIKPILFLPFYKEIQQKKFSLIQVAELHLPWQKKEVIVPLWEHQASSGRVFFLQHDAYFFRDGLYGTPTGDHPDNAQRFAFFCRASLEAMKAVNFQPDLIHAHDWQAALSLAYLRYNFEGDSFFQKTRSLFTVHNLAYQGIFPPEVIPLIDLPPDVFRMEEMEFYGRVNFLKAGLVYSTAISTVSPTYSQEIQMPEYGCGLDGVLRHRREALFGILNGIDNSVWDPASDPLLPHHFTKDDLAGKKKCKEALIKYFSFPSGSLDEPLIGMVSRLADQKGLDLVVASLERLFSLGLRLVILGQGDKKYHDLLEEAQIKYRGRLGVKIAFDDPLAHLIIAGSDMFLVPSRYEPCGLTQMYSLRYGTVPVVRATGGLADTIEDFDPATGKGTGFQFKEYKAEALVEAVERATQVYKEPRFWRWLVRRAMEADFSWEKVAGQYQELYQRIVVSA